MSVKLWEVEEVNQLIKLKNLNYMGKKRIIKKVEEELLRDAEKREKDRKKRLNTKKPKRKEKIRPN